MSSSVRLWTSQLNNCHCCGLEKRWGEVVHHLDITGAFLYGKLEEEINMELPRGLDTDKLFKKSPGKVCKLQRSLYGLKQTIKLWGDYLANCLTKLNFTRMPPAECSLEIRENGEIARPFHYVDDFLLSSPSPRLIKKVKEEISKLLEVTYVGPMAYFSVSGIQLERMLKVKGPPESCIKRRTQMRLPSTKTCRIAMQ